MLNVSWKTLDVPFQKDPSNVLIPWIVGMMVFLATLALISANTIHAVIKGWDNTQTNSIILEIPYSNDPNRLVTPQKAVAKFLKTSPQVIAFNAIVPQQDKDQSQDWAYIHNILPTLIDIELSKDLSAADLKNFQEYLVSLEPGLAIKEQPAWAKDAVQIGETIIIVSIIVAVLVALAAIATIAFVTQTGLKTHDKVIDVLQLVGAYDEYVAQQFQLHAIILGMKGAIIGLCLSACTLTAIYWFAADVNIPYFKENFSYFDNCIIIFFTPCVGIFLMTVAARFTVLNALSRNF